VRGLQGPESDHPQTTGHYPEPVTTPKLERKIARPRFWGGSALILIALAGFAPGAVRRIGSHGVFSGESLYEELFILALAAWAVIGLSRTRIVVLAAVVVALSSVLVLLLMQFLQA
jgi:hypothetical protein